MKRTPRPFESEIIDERNAQARSNIEGEMQDLGTVPDPDMGTGPLPYGTYPYEGENYIYTDPEDWSKIPGKRAGLDPQQFIASLLNKGRV